MSVSLKKTTMKQELLVRFGAKNYKMVANENTTFEDVKRGIYKLTRVHVKLQRVVNINFGDVDQNECKVRSVRQSKECGMLPLVLVIEKIDICGCTQVQLRRNVIEHQPIYKLLRQFEKEGIKFINFPRCNKYLLVLDINLTLYDTSYFYSPDQSLGVRPYLQEFLRAVYQYYDIVLWSTGTMKDIEKKVEILGMVNNPNYNIMWYMDRMACTFVDASQKRFLRFKPLPYIWRRLQQYGSHNSIICDDQKLQVDLNGKNGLLIKQYSLYCDPNDEELKNLKEYLIDLVRNCSDFRLADHTVWNDERSLLL